MAIPIPGKRHLQWHDTEFYALVHFGINSFTGKEWGGGDEKPSRFNPDQFDALQIVQACRDGGMKGFILTCKHHDGFCLWPTKTTEHCIRNSPWRNGKGDIVKEFEQACRKLGLKFGVYLSPWDRNNAAYGRPGYIETYKKQLHELLTGYGELFEVWFDGANGGDGYYGGACEKRTIDPSTYYQWDVLWKMVRELQPDACIFNGPDIRWVGNEKGVAADPCWHMLTPLGPTDPHLPPSIKTNCADRGKGQVDGTHWMPAECDFPLRPGWFHRDGEDARVMSPKKLLDTYFLSIGRGGNISLGLAPTRHGLLHENDVKCLKAFKTMLDELYVDLPEDADTEFNVVELREDIAKGQRIRGFKVEALVNGKWSTLAEGQSVGHKRLLKVPATKAQELKVTIAPAGLDGALLCVKRHFLAPSVAEPVISRDKQDFLKLDCPEKEVELHYTLDGSEPDASSPLYGKPLPLKNGGLVKAIALPRNPRARKSDVVTADFDYSKKLWRIVSCSGAGEETPAENIIDDDIETFWFVESSAPQSVEIDLGETLNLKAFTMTPRADGGGRGMPCAYEIHVSLDGKAWRSVAKGEFSNIQANPVKQIVPFGKTEEARYLRFTALRCIEQGSVEAAEIGVKVC